MLEARSGLLARYWGPPMAADDHGTEQQAPHDSIIQPPRQKRRPNSQEAEDLVLAKAVTGHKGSTCANVKSISILLTFALNLCCRDAAAKIEGHFLLECLAHVEPRGTSHTQLS